MYFFLQVDLYSNMYHYFAGVFILLLSYFRGGVGGGWFDCRV